MASLLVLGYPTISREDFGWIQSVREQHDELYYRVVDPHFTFVFPVFGFDAARFVEHVEERTRGVRRIPFVSRCAVVVKSVIDEYTHVFLVPDEGNSDIVRLHDRLYEGPLSPELRLDIPFIPHVGIGNAAEPMTCKRLADDLNRREFRIEGVIEVLDIASYENDRVTTIERIELEP